MKKLGLALGGGGARGCAHIGVIKALEEANIKIDYIAGTSIGSMIGGLYSGGNLNEFTEFLIKLKKIDIVKYLDLNIYGKGLIEGKKVNKLLKKYITKKNIEQGNVPFSAVATDLFSGNEVVISKGDLCEAIRASISIPGFFSPAHINKKYLIDGGVVNPLPVNVVEKSGVDIILAIDLNHCFIQEKYNRRKHEEKSIWRKWFKSKKPNIIETIENSVFIMQDQITQKNLEQYPAHFLIRPNLIETKVFDFHKAKALIDEGYKETKKIIPKLKKHLNS